MKQNRYLPFGYEAIDGKICISPIEAAAVKSIFEHYKHGLSYQSISEDLKHRQVTYLENKSDWNKNRVKRILENKKYLGTKQLPKLIEEQLFSEIQQTILSKTTKYRETPIEVLKLRKVLCCDECKKPLSRYITHSRDVWKCDDPACKVSIPKRVLEKKLLEIQNEIIRNQDAIESPNPHSRTDNLDDQITKLNEDLKNEMNQINLDEQRIKDLIYASATAAYNDMDDGNAEIISELIREKLVKAEPEETVNFDLIIDITSAIYVASGKTLTLRLKSEELVK